MARLTIRFDKTGKHESTTFAASNNYYKVSAENGVLKDNAIFCSGYNPPANLFTGIATCFSIVSNIVNSDDIPDWVTHSVNIDRSTMERKTQSMATQSGFTKMTSYRYDRTTTFGVLPQQTGGTTRTCSIILNTGFHVGTIDDTNGWIQESNNYNSYLEIIIIQEGDGKESGIFSNPYYTTKKDDVIVDEQIEVEGVAPIYIYVKSNGLEYSCNKLSLAGKQYNYSFPNPFNGYFNILNSDNSSDLHISELPSWIQYDIEDMYQLMIDGVISPEEWANLNPFDAWMNLQFTPNDSKNPREAVIDIHYKDIEDSFYIKYELHIIQEGIQEDVPEESKEALLRFKSAQIKLPFTESTEEYNTVFYHKNVTGFRVDTTEAWLTSGNIVAGENEGTLALTWSANDSTLNRTCTITLYATSSIDNSSLQTTIAVTQAAKDTGDDNPKEEDTTGDFVVVDTNTGEDYDSAALLFKDNAANIYSTLEAKDNTLFLGNYLNTNFSLQIHNSIGSLASIGIYDGRISVPLATRNSSVYSYTPDMTLNSQEKRVFKKGETYSLGLVFIRKNGVKSTVFYIGDYMPSADPSVVSSGDHYSMQKSQAYVTLNSTLLDKLRRADVIGVIPVCAQRSSHKVICQGFLNPTISSKDRKNSENLTSQYNWFQRLYINNEDRIVGEGESSHAVLAEIQARAYDDEWTYNSNIITMNTPEVETNDYLTEAELENCVIQSIWKSTNISYTNSVQLNVNGKYLHSKVIIPEGGYQTNRRETSLGLWHGFIDKGTLNETSSEFTASTKDDTNYGTFYVYPWQRNTVGGEGPESVILSKKYFTSMYINTSKTSNAQLGDVVKASIYRDDYPSLLKFDSYIYQGNVDYIINVTKPYKAFLTQSYSVEGNTFTWPKAFKDVGVYAGYNTEGEITDPIYMRYKASPHIALYFNTPVTGISNTVVCAELSHSNNSYVFENDPQVLSSLSWIKCGDIVSLENSSVNVYFTEGDYFYGRFDSLRTYPYSQEDVNSVTDIVSGMLCSRINLDARCDRNRGIGTALVTPENFNRFNPVYDQANNYFIYQYLNLTDKIYTRKYSNSIQWSLTKSYGNEVDDWCNIQEINTLDLDGNKGQLRALQRLNNNIIAFQDSGISQILFNESMQVASTEGVPIEIANSGKVNGKRYLYETIGCQDENAIAIAPSGLYFIDSINKSLYRLGIDASIQDLCILGGMKSWGLSTLDNTWKCWYDSYSQEVILTNPSTSLLYSDVFNRFQCFASYKDIHKVLSLRGRTYLFKKTQTNQSTYYNLWQKNAINNPIFFSIKYPVELEIVANPEPLLDKTFTNIEFRADGFLNDNYIPDASFTSIRVNNEYQDTGTVKLNKLNNKPSYLKKKFRIWHLDIPRSKKMIPTITATDIKNYINGTASLETTTIIQNLYPTIMGKVVATKATRVIASTPEANETPNTVTPLSINTRDRIRNPWCAVKLASDMNNMDKFIVHDIQIQYI